MPNSSNVMLLKISITRRRPVVAVALSQLRARFIPSFKYIGNQIRFIRIRQSNYYISVRR